MKRSNECYEAVSSSIWQNPLLASNFVKPFGGQEPLTMYWLTINDGHHERSEPSNVCLPVVQQKFESTLSGRAYGNVQGTLSPFVLNVGVCFGSQT